MELLSRIVASIIAAVSQESPIAVDSREQLFLDDYLVASMTNIARRIVPGRKAPENPVLRPDKPWEGKDVITYGSIIRDPNGTLRVWYHCGGGVGYAESGDGITWVKPVLDVAEYEGNKTNLVVVRDPAPDQAGGLPFFFEIFGVFQDDKDADTNNRFKMGYLSVQRNYTGPREDPVHPGQRRGLGVAGSPDGIHWHSIEPWATEAICDGATHWMFDQTRNKHVLYGRTKYVAPEVQELWSQDPWASTKCWGQSVARLESADFIHWDYTDPLTAPVVMTVDTQDPVGAEIYSMYVFPYGAQYLGLVQVFHNRSEGTLLDIQLAVSRDGVHFTRVGDRSPFIPCGSIGAWDRFNNSVATNPPLLIGGELRFYYGGRTYRHGRYQGADTSEGSGSMGFVSAKPGRFCALEASFDGGTITTKPLSTGASPDLVLNANSEFGSILVEIRDLDGNSLATSKPFTRNETAGVVEWEQGSPGDATKSPVVLIITLKNAQLFGLSFR